MRPGLKEIREKCEAFQKSWSDEVRAERRDGATIGELIQQWAAFGTPSRDIRKSYRARTMRRFWRRRYATRKLERDILT